MSQENNNTDSSENSETNDGITQSENAVQFINKEVLNPSVTPIAGTAKPIVDQAAAMMVQDMQTFLQGNEQILTVGIGKAVAYTLDYTDTTKQEAGTKALAAFEGVLTALNEFSTKIGASAAQIAKGFNSSS